MHKHLLGLALLLGLLVVGACSSPPALQKTTLPQPPSVDGALNEWGGGLSAVEDGVSMSAAPTDSLLYVAVVISEQGLIRSVARHGLVLWVSPTGAQAHTYGVQYPVGLRAQRPERAGSGAADPESGASRLDEVLPSDLAIIRNDTIRHRMPSRLGPPLRVQATFNTGALIYEAAIPLGATEARSNSKRWRYGLRTPLGPTVAVGVQTPDPDERAQFSRTSGIPSVTGTQGRRSSPGRQGRRRRQRAPTASPDRLLNLWTTLTLPASR